MPTEPNTTGETEPLGLTPYERRGLISPLRRDAKGDFANEVDVALVLANAEQILGTRCSTEDTPGEIPWDPEFGSLLPLIRHQNVRPVIDAQAHAYVVDALQRWEPRIRAKRTAVQITDRTLRVRVFCDVFDKQGRGRLVARDQTIEVILQRAA